MTLQELIDTCGAEGVLVPDAARPFAAAYTSDLLSDVMAHCPEESVLITVQNHKNTVAVSTLTGTVAILIVHSREVPEDMIALARQENVALLRTRDDQFTASCKIGAALARTA